MYYVVSHKRMKFLYRYLGYIAGDCKLYFVGHLIIDEETEELSYTCDVHVYDIPSRQWIQDFPKLKYQKRAPFVCFLDGKLYVLSSGSPYIPLSHFEMLDINNLFQGWVSLSEPTALVYENLLACHHAKIIDYSNKMLYAKLLDDYCTDIYGYSVDHKEWHTSALDMQTLPYRSRNLFKASWSKHCVIVEDHLYRFQVFQYSNGPPELF
ncbi:uncharacterized protein LOC132599262 [Lycium barbarum]|uniref:uncharacterized protein LOC132599262 n=1 Tax=Lycium barbarum TaxID=112863 RepID=UPI00293EBCEA|nr:uncharacterized protein LOC132599262 [Lycium barbarum]